MLELPSTKPGATIAQIYGAGQFKTNRGTLLTDSCEFERLQKLI